MYDVRGVGRRSAQCRLWLAQPEGFPWFPKPQSVLRLRCAHDPRSLQQILRSCSAAACWYSQVMWSRTLPLSTVFHACTHVLHDKTCPWCQKYSAVSSLHFSTSPLLHSAHNKNGWQARMSICQAASTGDTVVIPKPLL